MNTMGCQFFVCLTQRVSTSSTAARTVPCQKSTPPEPEGLAHDDKSRRRDERGGRGAQAVERTRDALTVAERLQESRDDEDHNDARRNETDGRRHRAGHAPGQEADVGRHVDADGAGGGLGHGDHVRELRAGEPAGLIRHIVEERKCGHAAADGEKAGLEKFPEKL